MRSLKDIQTAHTKRATNKRVEQAKFIRVKSGNKVGRRLVSAKTHKKLKAKVTEKKTSVIKAEHKRQKEQIAKAFTAGQDIIADASEKAKKLLNDAVQDQASAREVESELKAKVKDADNLLARTRTIAKDQEKKETQLKSRQEGITVTEQAITRMSDEAVIFKQNSIDLLQDIVALINLTSKRIHELHKQDELRQQLCRNISNVLGSVGEELKGKQEHLTRKDKELKDISAILEDGRISLNMAEKEIRNLSK